MTNQINRLTRILERNDKAEMEYNRATEELRDFLHELYLDEINNEERAQAITNLNQLAQKAQDLALKVYEEARNLETTLISETIDEQLS